MTSNIFKVLTVNEVKEAQWLLGILFANDLLPSISSVFYVFEALNPKPKRTWQLLSCNI